MQHVSVLSPRLLLPAGKDGLVTKGFIFSCHQLFISAKQAAKAIFFLLCCGFFRARTWAARRQHEPRPSSVCATAMQICTFSFLVSLWCELSDTDLGSSADTAAPQVSKTPKPMPASFCFWSPGTGALWKGQDPCSLAGSSAVCLQRISSLLAASSGGQLQALLSATSCKCLTPAGKGRTDKTKSSSSGKGNERGKDGVMGD